MIKKILVPVDGSDHSIKAVEFAASMAKKYNGTLHILHVVKKREMPKGIRDYIEGEGITESPSSVYLELIAKKVVDMALEAAKSGGIKDVIDVVIEGDPAETVITYAEDHEMDIIIMGSRGLGNFKGLVMGSVSNKVCHMSGCTCVTVK